MINLSCLDGRLNTYTLRLEVATLQETIELRDAFARERLCNNQECETHHGSTAIPVFSLGSERTILEGLLSAQAIKDS